MKSVISSSFKGGKPAAPPPSTTLPPALSSKNTFAPPPRRIPTSGPPEGDTGNVASESRNKWANLDLAPQAVRRVPSHNALQRQPTPEPEPAQGELAEALYDYTSDVSIILTH